ncbi:MAG: glycine cleavage system protein [Actinomycetota bacterium]
MIHVTLPTNLRYTKDHEWVLITGSTARIGITDYAQDALGDIVFVQMPDVGTEVSANDSFSEIESTKSVNDVYAPVSGTVSRVNDALSATPELLNSDPYGEGWICEIEMSGDAADLLSPADYQALIG